MTTPDPQPAPQPAPRAPRPRRWLMALAATTALVVVVVAIVALLTHTAGRPAAQTSPQRATDAYYAAVHTGDAKAAFALLCPAQQAEGFTAYAANVAANKRTGTGIRSWTRRGAGQVQGQAADVPGRIVLDDGTATPIQVLLLQVGGGWRVCSSDLGGILPAPGTGSRGGGGVAT